MTLEEVKEYLRIDHADDDNYLNTLLEVAQIYVDECCGEAYKKNSKKLKLANLVMKKIISDMYENRGTEIPNNTKKDNIVTTIFESLSLEEYSNETV